MKNRKNDPISFGITLTSTNRTGAAKQYLEKRGSTVRSQNILPGKTEQLAIWEFDFPRRELPQIGKLTPFTPDMFICEPVPLPAFPTPRKLFEDEERIGKALKNLRYRTASYRTASYSSPGKSSPLAVSIPWAFIQIIFAGVFVTLKYMVIAISIIITVGCMLCAGRRIGGLR